MENPDIIKNGFKNSGIYPWNPNSPNLTKLVPGSIFASSTYCPTMEEVTSNYLTHNVEATEDSLYNDDDIPSADDITEDIPMDNGGSFNTAFLASPFKSTDNHGGAPSRMDIERDDFLPDDDIIEDNDILPLDNTLTDSPAMSSSNKSGLNQQKPAQSTPRLFQQSFSVFTHRTVGPKKVDQVLHPLAMMSLKVLHLLSMISLKALHLLPLMSLKVLNLLFMMPLQVHYSSPFLHSVWRIGSPCSGNFRSFFCPQIKSKSFRRILMPGTFPLKSLCSSHGCCLSLTLFQLRKKL